MPAPAIDAAKYVFPTPAPPLTAISGSICEGVARYFFQVS